MLGPQNHFVLLKPTRIPAKIPNFHPSADARVGKLLDLQLSTPKAPSFEELFLHQKKFSPQLPPPKIFGFLLDYSYWIFVPALWILIGFLFQFFGFLLEFYSSSLDSYRIILIGFLFQLLESYWIIPIGIVFQVSGFLLNFSYWIFIPAL